MDGRTVTISLDEYAVLVGNEEKINAIMNYMLHKKDRYVECDLVAALLGRELPAIEKSEPIVCFDLEKEKEIEV
ncbi:MAG: hypothetical protein U0N03_13240 [Lachnospiraceae bacterium]